MQIKFFLNVSYCLDNFSPHSIIYQNQKYPTAEHLYQSLKFQDAQIIGEIVNAASPMQAKTIAKKYQDKRIDNWSEIKLETMKMILNLKFQQHTEIKEYLKSTKQAELIEDNPEDNYWGIGNGTGSNLIGKIWVEIRNLNC